MNVYVSTADRRYDYPDAALGVLDMFDYLKKKFGKKSTKKVEGGEKTAKAPKQSEKDAATAAGQPWVKVLSVELDPDNIGNGAFEIDFNDIFVARLVKAGYKGKDDYAIVDMWFTDICRNVVMENFEQWEANHPDQSPRTAQRKDLGGGRTEVS
jgi:hypothetical protein